MKNAKFEILAKWLLQSKQTVAFTGAGISTESGIPDFRSPGGVWSRFKPVYFDEFMASAEARLEYWRQKSEAHIDFADALPNLGHKTLADWESSNLLRGVITQNIDGLHQIAGSKTVLELHGTAREVACMDCGHRIDADQLVKEFRTTNTVPVCNKCESGRMKHATVSFGQMLPPDVLQEATHWSEEANLMIVLGSSLVVTPAADLPRLTKEAGGRLVIINRDETPLDPLADMVLRAPIGETLSAIDAVLCNVE